MAEPNAIVADPHSSDGSEESWILLDEMDEAMQEEFNSSPTVADENAEQSTSTDTLNEPSAVEVAAEATPSMTEETLDYPSNVEAISSEPASCASNDEDDDKDLVVRLCQSFANLRSTMENVQEHSIAYDELNDGSTTDGSISILGDHEFNHDRFDSDDLSTHTPSPQPVQMWMRCNPIDMNICNKRESRSRDTAQLQPPTPDEQPGILDSVAELVIQFLESLHIFLSHIYLLNVILLFLTVAGMAILLKLNLRYTECKTELQKLELQLYEAKMNTLRIEADLYDCHFRIENNLPSNHKFNNFEEIDGVIDDMFKSTVQTKPNCQENELNGECEIQPTRLSIDYEDDIAPLADLSPSKTVWTGADDDLVSTQEIFEANGVKYIEDCGDDYSLFSEYNRNLCGSDHKPKSSQQELSDKVYPTDYSYEKVDDRECNPNKIDFNLGIEHARKVLRDTNCDDEGTLKYLQKAYDNFLSKSKSDAVKLRKETKIDKTAGKWEKSQKIAKHDSNADERFNEKNERRIKKLRKDDNKENKRSKEKKKNDRKRDMVKVYDHRHDD